jgi:hypothetical protein
MTDSLSSDELPTAESHEPLANGGDAASAAEEGRAEITEFLPPHQPLRLPGPGLPEALAWCVGLFTAHGAAAVVLVVVIVVLMMAGGRGLGPFVSPGPPGGESEMVQVPSDITALDELPEEYLLLLIGGDQLLVLLLTLVAVSLRLRGRVSQTLNFSALRPLHVLIVVGLTLPLATLCGELYRVVHLGWSHLVDLWPMLRWLDESNAVDELQTVAKEASLPLMLLIIAVAPAVGEELVFRGVIGRGLVARWGLIRGVALTSILFGVVHFHPAHALAVIPLGAAMHLLYLGTRSFWAPVLLHFLNNSWATLAAKLAAGSEDAAAALDEPSSPVLLLASTTAVIVLGTLLFRTRTRYVQPDGREWDPGYVTVEVPPVGVAQRVDGGCSSGRQLLTAVMAWAAFGAAFVAEVAASIP